jgi:alpha-beta hydrolase superfamily lysophospholipase
VSVAEPASLALERVVEVLSRIVPVAAAIRRATLRVALVGTVAGALIVYAALRDGAPEAARGWLATVVVIGLAAAPPLVLGTFWLLLGEVVELPARIRRMPGETRAHAEELGRLAREARDPRRSRARRVPGLVWRTLRVTGSSRELLTPYAPLLPLLSVPFLTAVAFAALGVVVEVAIALLVLLVLAL